MKQFNKLTIFLNSSAYIDGEFKLKVITYDIIKDSPKSIIIADHNREVRRNKSEIGKVKTDFKNNSFDSLSYYCYCYEDDIEHCTQLLVNSIKKRFESNECLYNSSLKALAEGLKVVYVV